jgi:hypothetical protein
MDVSRLCLVGFYGFFSRDIVVLGELSAVRDALVSPNRPKVSILACLKACVTIDRQSPSVFESIMPLL